GLAGTSLAWGLWASEQGGMAGALGEGDIGRMSRAGVSALSASQGLALLDAALVAPDGALVPMKLDPEVLRAQFAGGEVPHLFRTLVRGSVRKAASTAAAAPSGGQGERSLAERLAALDAGERGQALVDLVRADIAAVLGYPSPDSVDATKAFKELGFDSLTAVELRNRLNTVTGLRLPASLIFDYPTPVALAGHLETELIGTLPESASSSAAPDASRTGARTDDEPIAVVAMSCRYPGGVRTPEDLWHMVSFGEDGLSGFPTNRNWDIDAPADLQGDEGPAYITTGAFLHDADQFDPAFFGINPREALAMDPQQRLLLETSWEAFERAGIVPATLRGSATGVFVGMSSQGYSATLNGAEGVEGYVMTGDAASVASGRLSYSFGLEGPAVTVDTACSSSLVALHLAVRALRQGECTMALAGGAAIMPTPTSFAEFSRQRGLAPDGRCKSFAAAANGTGWGEGVGMLVLERLSDARRKGHQVLAVVRGSAINQDGASNGLTAPNGPSQQRVIQAALADAQLATRDVDAVEAHGTGTMLGDPIEAQALIATYGKDRPAEQPLWLGSLKSNISHTQAAAGVAGVIKMVMAMRHGVLPQTLNVDAPTPEVDWSAGGVELLTGNRAWPERDGAPRRAAVSSFGISGTNAHVIVEQAPEGQALEGQALEVRGPDAVPAQPAGPQVVAGTVPLVLSGRTPDAVRGQAALLRAHLLEREEADLTAVARSLAMTRSRFEHRGVALGADRDELLAALDRLAQGDTNAPGAIEGRTGTGVTRPVFVFPGQGSQWAGMAVELLESSPVFAGRMRECGEALSEFVDWDLIEELNGDHFDRVDVVQPVLFAVMVSLAAVWRAAGVEPAAVVGHSQGEIAAACVAGALSLEDAARVVALRSQAILELSGKGGMVSLVLPEDETREILAEWGDRISVAAANGPSQVVVSGEPEALRELVAHCEQREIRARTIPVDYASHSAYVEAIESHLAEALAPVAPQAPQVPVFSTLTGDWLEHADTPMDGGYWYRNLRQTVLFEQATRGLLADGHNLFLEMSPHPVLTVPVQATIDDTDQSTAVTLGSLRRDEGGAHRLAQSIAEAHVNGAELNWTNLYPETLPGDRARTVDLPTYAFQRQRYWPQAAAPGVGDVASAGIEAAGHPLLGASVELADSDEHVLTGRLSLRTQPWLADHAVADTVLLPGTAFLELALRAGDEVGCGLVEELALEAPLVVAGEAAVTLQVWLGAPDDSGRRPVTVSSRTAGATGGVWTRHASGTLGASDVSDASDDLTVWPPAGAEALDVEGFYDRLAEAGLGYGPAFQGLRAAWRGATGGAGATDPTVYAEIHLPESEHRDAQAYGLHPALLDAALHAVALAPFDDADGVRLPFAWSGVSLHAEGATTLRVRVTRSATGGGVELLLADDTGAPVARADSLELRPVDTGQLRAASGAGHHDALFRVEWTALRTPAAPTALSWAAVGPDGLKLAARLAASGAGAAVDSYADPAALRAALDAGAPVPGTVLVAFDPGPDADVADTARAGLHRALGLIQTWLDDERLAESRLVLVTRGAVSVDGGDVRDLAHAALWGLTRSAQSENPGGPGFVLVDLDDCSGADAEAAGRLLSAGLALEEPQLAVRGGELYAPRLVAAPAANATASPDATAAPGTVAATPLDPEGTVLITGATGTLGALVARHLVAEHGVRYLLLTSRRGPDAPGAAELVAALESLGAEVRLAACDAADRDALAAALGTVPDAHPLTAVVHTAGVLDDGMIGSLTPERIDGVLRPKLDAALNLAELTEGENLADFVLFSSAAATFGGPGQGNYAAANAFLDAFAHRLRAEGVPATALASGLWAQSSEMTGHLDATQRGRISRGGVVPLTSAEGLALFDAGRTSGLAQVLPIRLDLAALRAGARSGVPPLLRRLVRVTGRRTAVGAAPAVAGAGALRRRLAATEAAERPRVLAALVREEAAAVLGLESAEHIEDERGFLEIGFDSLTGVELRNRLMAATGLRLPATLVFQNRTPRALAERLAEQLGEQPVEAAPVQGESRSDAQQGERTGQPETAPATQQAPAAPAAPRPATGLAELYDEAARQGRADDLIPVLRTMERFRSSFTDESELAEPRASFPLSRGPEPVGVVLFTSYIGRSSAYDYARFGTYFRDRRDVSVITHPGFLEGELLPADKETLVRLHADTVEREAGGKPYVLAGHSSGGLVAHAVARELESRGAGPAGVVLVDTYVDEAALGDMAAAMGQQLSDRYDSVPGAADNDWGDAWVTAMARYMFLGLLPEPLKAPTLLVRAGEPIMEWTQEYDWRPSWKLEHTAIDVPGNHFTVMEEHSRSTARAVEEWLDRL
ncbi:SDR family NAD(P)-dependent oxidoreductase, partial [Streptomyces sp. NPDC058257]|uniref:SDR family NAD(P)-dependent oxidoreductase n=1 Tax=Streptomyces sp. NPDC058257 TaxID=3346409 RepID=UPI0036E93791